MGDSLDHDVCDNISIYPPSSDEHMYNYMVNVEKRNKSHLVKLFSKIYNLTSYNNDVDDFNQRMSPYYGMDSKNENVFAHLGPVIGLNYGKSANPSNPIGSLVVVNPNSLQRFRDEKKLLQHKAIHPIAITSVAFGSIGGIGKCIFYATQCGKVYVLLSDNFEQIFMVDTSEFYENKKVELSSLSLISPVGRYVEYISVGNIYGHIFLYRVPSMSLVNVILKGVDTFELSTPTENTHDDYTPKALESLYNDDLVKEVEYKSDKKFPQAQTDGLFVSTMNVGFKNDIWVGFGDTTLTVLSAPEFTIMHNTKLRIKDNDFIATNIQFSRIHEIALILLGNDQLMVRDICSFNCLRIIASNILTCGFPISTLLLADTFDSLISTRTCILIVAGMDGSICLRRLERKDGTLFAWTLIKRLVQKDDSQNRDNQVPILSMHLDELSDSFFIGDARGLVRRCSNFLELYNKYSKSDSNPKDFASNVESSSPCNESISDDLMASSTSI